MIPAGEVVELAATLIRNGCVNDGTPASGHEERSVATLAAYLGEAGQVWEPSPGRQSVLYRVPGRVPGAPSLMLMGHLDVVPVNPTGWSRDPFAGEVVDGVLWGRGAVDMLNQTAAMAAVFKRHLGGEAPRPAGDLLLLAVADEEAGGRLGADWLVRNAWDEVACDYQLNEIGMPNIGAALPVTVAEKGPFWRRLHTEGIPGHASQPYGRSNALVPLATALARLAETGTPVEITPEWEQFVDGLDLPAEEREALVDPDRIDAAIDDLALDDVGYARWVHACTHMTVTPTVITAGVKANVVPDEGHAEIDIRAVPGQDATTVDDHLRKVLGPDLYEDIEIEPVMDMPANGSAPSGPLWAAIGEAQQALTGATRLIPTLIPVATDARFFRARGTVAYGVGLFDERVTFGDLLAMFHGNDERVSVESLRLTAELTRLTVERFSAKTGA